MSLTDLAENMTISSGPYKEGHDAYWDGILYEQNPYVSNSVQYQHWTDGWCAAEEADIDGRWYE